MLDVFIPHIRRSLNLYNKLQMAGAQTVFLETAIDTLATALVLLNQNGEVAFLNATAARLTRRCRELCVRRDKLYATRHADTLQLERLIKKATGANGGRPLGGVVAIQRTLGKQPLQVTAAPLPRDNRTTLASDRRAVAVLMIHDPNEQTYVPQETIGTMFGLTPAEARLLLALSHGQTLKQYSDEQRVTRDTARTHLKSVFAKTRTSKQSDLVRLMSAFTYSATPSQR